MGGFRDDVSGTMVKPGQKVFIVLECADIVLNCGTNAFGDILCKDCVRAALQLYHKATDILAKMVDEAPKGEEKCCN